MTIERKKKTINVDKKVKKKPVYEDKRVLPDPGGQPGIEFNELTPEIEAFCQLMADGTPRNQILTLIPNMSTYKYKTWLEKENVKLRIEEIKAEALLQNAGQLEPAMISLAIGLTRYFKVKAALLDLSDSVADKVLERAIDFCKAVSPLTKASDMGKQISASTDEPVKPEKEERRPLWEESDFEDVDQPDVDEIEQSVKQNRSMSREHNDYEDDE